MKTRPLLVLIGIRTLERIGESPSVGEGFSVLTELLCVSGCYMSWKNHTVLRIALKDFVVSWLQVIFFR